MRRAREQARELWGRHPAGTILTSAAERSPEFYEEMRSIRYRQQPWHPAVLDRYAGERLLEIGCGAGTDLAYLGRRFRWAVGIDLAEHGARIAAGSLAHWGVAGAALVADGESLPFRGASFDLVYSFGVLHHTDHPEAVADGIRRVLRPGGRAVIAVYHRWSLFTLQRLAVYVLKLAFREESWRDFLARCERGAVAEGLRPAIRLYSRRSARRLLAGFGEVHTHLAHAGSMWPLPRPLDRLASRLLGWYVIVEGVR